MRTMKIVSVTITMAAAVGVCQSMLESEEFADLKNAQ